MVVVITLNFLENYPLETMFEKIRDMGLTKVELASPFHLYWRRIWTDPGFKLFETPEYYKVIRKVATEYGIEIAGFFAGMPRDFNPYSAKPEDIKATVNCLKRNLEVCQVFGASYMTMEHGPPVTVPPRCDWVSPAHLALPKAVMWEGVVEALRQGADLAGDYGILMVDEYHPGYLGLREEDPMEEAPKLVDDVGSKWFKVCLDLCHAYVIGKGNAKEFIKVLGNRIGHVHLADGNGIPRMHLPLGTGLIDVKGCIEAIKATGYKGKWSICMAFCPAPEYGVKKSLEWLANQYGQPVALEE